MILALFLLSALAFGQAAYTPLGTAATKAPGAQWSALRNATVHKGETLWLCIAADFPDWDHFYITWAGHAVRWYGPVWLYAPAETETGDLVVQSVDPAAVIALTASALGTDAVGSGSSQAGTGDSARMILPSSVGPVIEIMMLATKGPGTDLPASSFTSDGVKVGQRAGTTGGADDSNWTIAEFHREHVGTGFEFFYVNGFTPRYWYTDNAANPAVLVEPPPPPPCTLVPIGKSGKFRCR